MSALLNPPSSTAERPRVGVVVLTMGKRPEDLTRAIKSVLAQRNVMVDVAVVGNGWRPDLVVGGVKSVYLPENLGIPAGRNAGVSKVSGEYLFFLDDDASLPDSDFLSRGIAMLVEDPSIGIIQPMVIDPSGTTPPKRWIPRLRKGDATHSSNVFSVWEGAVLTTRAVFDRIGGWGDPYFYAHEGIELAWRTWNAGYRVWYAGNLVANHPVINPTRHDFYFRLNARNRVWLAKRNLPWILAPFYVGSWTLVQLVRWVRHREGLKPWFSGWVEGWKTSPGGREAMPWSTIWRMTRAGRFPIL